MDEHQKDFICGTLFAFIAALGLALMNACAKYAMDYAPFPFVLFMRFGVGVLLLLPFCLPQKGLFKIRRSKLFLVRSLLGLIGIGLMFYAMQYLPVANVVLFSVTYPLFLPLIARIAFKRPLPLLMGVGIALGFVGVGLVLHPSANSFALIPSLLALFVGLITACTFLIVRSLSTTESRGKIIFYFYTISLLLCLAPAIVTWPSLSPYVWLAVILMGIIGTLYQFFLTAALNRVHSVIVAPLMFLAVFFSMILDWLVWNEPPTLLMYIGSAVLLIGLILTKISNSRNHHLYR